MTNLEKGAAWILAILWLSPLLYAFWAAFHPPAYVRGEFAQGFEVLELAPEGATGNPPQDAWVLRKV